MKKFLSIALLITINMVLFLTGCNSLKYQGVSEESLNKKTKVTFWAATITSEREEFFKKFQKEVSETYPDIELELVGIPGDLSAYRQKVDVAIAAGKAPDITNDFRSSLITNGYYEDLTSYFDKWEDKDKINSNLINSIKSYAPSGNGLYALPYSSQTWNLWIRSDWLKEKGLEVPGDWNQFFNTVEKLTDKEKNKYGLAIRGGTGSSNTLEILMYSYSGIANYFTSDGKCTINNPRNLEFAEKYLGCFNKFTDQNDLIKSWTELANSFQSGKAGIVVHNLGSGKSMVTAFDNDTSKFQASKFPVSVNGYIVEPGIMPLGLSMSSKSENKDAVWKVMRLYLKKDINTEYCKVYGEIPANMESRKDCFFKNTQYMSIGVDLENSKDVKFTDNPYYLPTYSNIQSEMDSAIQKVMSRQMTAKEMLDKWAGLLEKAKKDYDNSLNK
ncbi:sugar ABC transporter substrate-binding protein [Clostridium sp. SHJSY1]|uniref:ABC transporter substrate-binding protein n=1 Tax=Clostridium sp. SHJSY1 TaxID=2942483 RepID=UPI002876CEF2|nr:sugar ABC transporter substrate-binding protein [Clostridium sp. SHJSY1]MDS0525137.1 sugar ABC transporter substrate-binding protein [Clostridium sp. SHJSY1]